MEENDDDKKEKLIAIEEKEHEKIEEIPKLEENLKRLNVQILYNFELESKKNENNEIIIKELMKSLI